MASLCGYRGVYPVVVERLLFKENVVRDVDRLVHPVIGRKVDNLLCRAEVYVVGTCHAVAFPRIDQFSGLALASRNEPQAGIFVGYHNRSFFRLGNAVNFVNALVELDDKILMKHNVVL